MTGPSSPPSGQSSTCHITVATGARTLLTPGSSNVRCAPCTWHCGTRHCVLWQKALCTVEEANIKLQLRGRPSLLAVASLPAFTVGLWDFRTVELWNYRTVELCDFRTVELCHFKTVELCECGIGSLWNCVTEELCHCGTVSL